MDNSTKFFDEYMCKLLPPYPRSDIPNEWIPLYGPWKNEYRSEVRERKDIINYYFYDPESDVIYSESTIKPEYTPSIVRRFFERQIIEESWYITPKGWKPKRNKNISLYRAETSSDNHLIIINGTELNLDILKIKCHMIGAKIRHITQQEIIGTHKIEFEDNTNLALFLFYYSDYIQTFDDLGRDIVTVNNYSYRDNI